MTTSSGAPASPQRKTWLARISAVQQISGASGLIEASPVSMPTCSAPKSSHRAKNFSLTKALIGAVYHARRPCAMALNIRAVATRVLPEPVGVLRMTCRSAKSSSNASS